MSGFLSPFEANLIRRDAKAMIASSESADIEIHYQHLSGQTTVDEVYGEYVDGTWVGMVIEARAIQKIVKPKQEDVLKFGVIEAGDCIFYLDTAIDLSVIEHSETVRINVVGEDTQWFVVPRHSFKPFYESIQLRIGNTPITQPLAAKLSR